MKEIKHDNIEKSSIEKKENFEKNKRKVIVIMIIAILFVFVIGGILFFVLKDNNKMPDMPMPEGMSQVEITENTVTASGTTTIGIVAEEFEPDYIETELIIEEVYLSSNEEVKAGTKILKVQEDCITEAREELENAKTEADLAYRAGVITCEQSKITAKYDYDVSLLEGQYAQEVYNETLQTLQKAVDDAQKAVDEANEDVAEYTDAITNDTYDEEYQVSYLLNKYESDLELLKDFVDDNSLAWESVTGSGGMGGAPGGGHTLSTAQTLYKEVDEEYREYKSALEKYETALSDAEYGLKKLALQMPSLQSALESAKNAYEEGVISAKATYDASKKKAEMAQSTYDTAIKKAEEELEILHDTFEDAQENLSEFEELIGDGYLYTSSAGTVLVVAAREENALTGGEMVLAYSNRDEMTVAVSVDQADIDKLSVGDTAYVAITEYGNYEGIITSINPISNSNSRSQITYSVTVQLNGDTTDLSANLSAQVIFNVGGADDEEN